MIAAADRTSMTRTVATMTPTGGFAPTGEGAGGLDCSWAGAGFDSSESARGLAAAAVAGADAGEPGFVWASSELAGGSCRGSGCVGRSGAAAATELAGGRLRAVTSITGRGLLVGCMVSLVVYHVPSRYNAPLWLMNPSCLSSDKTDARRSSWMRVCNSPHVRGAAVRSRNTFPRICRRDPENVLCLV